MTCRVTAPSFVHANVKISTCVFNVVDVALIDLSRDATPQGVYMLGDARSFWADVKKSTIGFNVKF